MFRTISNFFSNGSLAQIESSLSASTAADEFTQMWNRERIIQSARRYGYEPDSAVVTRRLNIEFCREVSYTEACRWFDPRSGYYVEAIDNGTTRGIKINAMAHKHGAEHVGRIVDAWVGNLNFVSSVLIGSHETAFYDANGDVKVRFYGSGRKMHHDSAFRAYNAQEVIKLLGIEMSVEQIAVRDLNYLYAPLKFERQDDGSWIHHELAAVQA